MDKSMDEINETKSDVRNTTGTVRNYISDTQAIHPLFIVFISQHGIFDELK